jgi:gliding motility-associated-like protein
MKSWKFVKLWQGWNKLFVLGIVVLHVVFSQAQVTFTTPGTYSWTVPPCVTEITVQVWGAGGGGGSVWTRFDPTTNGPTSNEACVTAGGGGGGGFAQRIYTVVPGQVYTVVVGAGGIPGPINGSGNNRANNGGSGGNSTFSGPATSGPGTLTGFGGGGGGAANFLRSCLGGCSGATHQGANGAGGIGAGGANGTLMYTGGNGSAGVHAGNTQDRSGSGGGGAGSTGNGGNANSTTGGNGGSGGGGNGGNGIVQPYGNGFLGTNGNPGLTIGGGGGGASGHNRSSNNNTHYTRSGGAGARGEVRILFNTGNQPTPTFTQVAPICSGGVLNPLPTVSTNGIYGTWSPALNNAATTTYTFTPNPNECANTTTMTITVNASSTPSFAQVAPICLGESLSPLPTVSQNGISGNWSPALNSTQTTTYTFTPTAGQCATSTQMTIQVNSDIEPTFAQAGPFCEGTVLNPLPTTSLNGITGAWSPALNNMATTTYTFTPNIWQCAVSTEMTVEIQSDVLPVFDPVVVCQGQAGQVLPAVSANGISGTWAEPVSTNVPGQQTYTFVPSANQCAINGSVVLTVLGGERIAPLGAQCSGSTYNFQALPNPGPAGATYNWTVTPPAGIQASPQTGNGILFSTVLENSTNAPLNGGGVPYIVLEQTYLGVTCPFTFNPTVNPEVVPLFDAVGPYCSGAQIPALNAVSVNGISGSWSPAIDNQVTSTYLFTPNAGQCATTASIEVVIEDAVIPQFTPQGPYCEGASIANLPTTSLDGITGNWSPAINNTATTTYTFSSDAGGCVLSVETTIVINSPDAIPLFSPIPALCQGDVPPVLSTVSENGISGTWSGSISTNLPGTTSYTFTPNPDECGIPVTLDVQVTAPQTPVFDPLADLCQFDGAPVLSTVSLNGISGVWSNTVTTTVSGAQTITFTPNQGQCAVSISDEVLIFPLPDVFAGEDLIICIGESATLNGQGAVDYSWDNGVTNGIAFTPQEGTTVHTVIGTSAQGCQASDEVVIQVLPLPVADAGPDQTVCPGENVTLNGSGATGLVWTNGVVNGVAFIPPSGQTFYTLTATNAAGCSSTDEVLVTVLNTPQPSFEVQGSGCAPLTVSLVNTTNGSSNCVWSLSNGAEITGCGTISSVLETSGCYDITLTIEEMGCSASLTVNQAICVDEAPVADFFYSPQSVSNFDTEVNFTNQSSGATTYFWSFEGGSATSNELNPIHNFPEDGGTYQVMLIAYSPSGCPDTAYASVFVEEEEIFYVPNTFTPDGDQFNQVFQPVFSSGFDVYSYQLLIFNRWGELIFESFDHTIGWDGSYGANGEVELCQDGIYIWKIYFKRTSDDERRSVTGHVNLLR